jgi:hypothetical protein
MRRLFLLLGVALSASLLVAGPASALAFGEIRMTMHTHSDANPNSPNLLFPTDRLSWAVAQGEDFSYSSRTCQGNAPFNDVGLNFIPDYPGIDDDADHTAKVRHRIHGIVTAAFGDRGVISGKTTTVVCAGTVPSPHSIVTNFTVQYIRSGNNALLVNGGFTISPTESTGTFRDMQGGGRIQGRFTCLSAPSCAERGFFTDFVGHSGDPSLGPGLIQPGVVGTYFDPTVTTGGASA